MNTDTKERRGMYRKKPVVIEAMLFDGNYLDEVAEFCGGRYEYDSGPEHWGEALYIDTPEGTMRAQPGDWIIKGVKGEFYPCKPDIFAATYEPVTPAAARPGERDYREAWEKLRETLREQSQDDRLSFYVGAIRVLRLMNELIPPAASPPERDRPERPPLDSGQWKLCYVGSGRAWFTTAELSKQWGDDWNDAPYEHNAGTPYEWRDYMLERGQPEYHLLAVAFEGPVETPASGCSNSPFSVEQINAGAMPWLRTESWHKPYEALPAGASFAQFREMIERLHGRIFIPLALYDALCPPAAPCGEKPQIGE